MAPVNVNVDPDDDFILTISDNDSAHLVFEEDEPASDPSILKPQNRKKRKHDEEARKGHQLALKDKTDKSMRRSKKRKIDNSPTRNDSPQSEESWTAYGQDDGAIDPDFEFQVEELNNGVTENFDGWGLNDDYSEQDRQGDKKGVDIDELIARRRKDSLQNLNATNGFHEGMGEDLKESEGDNDAVNSDPEKFDIGDGEEKEEDEDDGTMAEDAFGMGVFSSGEERENGDEEDKMGFAIISDNESVAEPVPHPDDVNEGASSAEEEDDPEETARREAFFAPEEHGVKLDSRIVSSGSFQDMSLSRPILRGLAALGFSEPTPIQTKTIPAALLGKDIVGGAVTGSGKTAAFIIPILERLLYRPKKIPTSRVAILMPTRELAVQCFNVAKKLASFTDISFCQLVGGFSLREQESVLRNRPDVIIATPGRFIDHMRNSASFTVDTLEILVLDEADRMLEDGFADELNEILTTIPKSRQTMLFSATMTDRVDKLIRVGLNRPVRLMVDARKQTVGTLVQEFVRLRPGREDKRLAYLMYLCQTIYTERTIIFFRQKKEAHRVRIIFGLCGIKAAELHGSMSQEQRISALSSFRSSQSTHLLATDLASRGLDISNISTVINYEAPQSHEIYLHRVGRTARAGRAGRSCTIAAEPDRKVVKQAVKSGKAQGAKIVSRVVEPALAHEWAVKIEALGEEVDAVLKEEKEVKALAGAEMQVRKGENIMAHEEEIKARPKRTWFESEREKTIARKSGMVELNGAVGMGKKKKKGKLSGKDRKRLDVGRERAEGRMWKKGKGDAEVRRDRGKVKEREKDKDKGGGRGKTRSGREGRSKGKVRRK